MMSTTESIATPLAGDRPAAIATDTVAVTAPQEPRAPRRATTKIKEPIAGRLFKWLILGLVAVVMLVPLYIMVISAFKPGLAMNATSICLCKTKTIRPTRTTNTSIRNRKMRGDDSLSGSSSLAMTYNCYAERPECAVWHRPVTKKISRAGTAAPIKPLIELKLGWSTPCRPF